MSDEPVATAVKDAALRALSDYTGVNDPEKPWWNLNMPKALDIMLPAIEKAVAERLIAAVRRAGTADVTWLREHKQNHEDLVRIVGTEDGYNAAIRTIRDEVNGSLTPVDDASAGHGLGAPRERMTP